MQNSCSFMVPQPYSLVSFLLDVDSLVLKRIPFFLAHEQFQTHFLSPWPKFCNDQLQWTSRGNSMERLTPTLTECQPLSSISLMMSTSYPRLCALVQRLLREIALHLPRLPGRGERNPSGRRTILGRRGGIACLLLLGDHLLFTCWK